MSSWELTADECRFLLGSKRVGRVVFTDNALPSALPVDYLLEGDDIVFRTDSTGRLAAAVAPAGSVLAFQVDSIGERADVGWSVLVVGLARRVVESAESPALQLSRPSAWGGADPAGVPGDGGAYVRIPLSQVSGRRVSAGGGM
jgi:nitroimidazol reductase NimA-like FMN-containing flavoprotein (pyridoxamine 5'-phosphate oxidase superfamily)